MLVARRRVCRSVDRSAGWSVGLSSYQLCAPPTLREGIYRSASRRRPEPSMWSDLLTTVITMMTVAAAATTTNTTTMTKIVARTRPGSPPPPPHHLSCVERARGGGLTLESCRAYTSDTPCVPSDRPPLGVDSVGFSFIKFFFFFYIRIYYYSLLILFFCRTYMCWRAIFYNRKRVVGTSGVTRNP